VQSVGKEWMGAQGNSGRTLANPILVNVAHLLTVQAGKRSGGNCVDEPGPVPVELRLTRAPH
jgi:hypothetical protein